MPPFAFGRSFDRAMKDLTHYFASPPKPSEADGASVADSRAAADLSEKQKSADKNVDEQKTSEKSPARNVKRAKLGFSEKTSNDEYILIDVEDHDVEEIYDCAPTPELNKQLEKSAATSNGKIPNDCRKSNAFKVLMTNKTVRRNTLSSVLSGELKLSNKGNVSPDKRSSKIIELGYTKRKLNDEDETIRLSKSKKAKLITFDSKTDQTDDESVPVSDKTTKCTVGTNSNKPWNKSEKSHKKSKGKKNSSCDTSCLESEGQLSAAACNVLLPRTPKTKSKWALRVKLQSYDDSNSELDVDNASDEEFIFTPKSKAKFHKREKSSRREPDSASRGESASSRRGKRDVSVAGDEKSVNSSESISKNRNDIKIVDVIDTDSDSVGLSNGPVADEREQKSSLSEQRKSRKSSISEKNAPKKQPPTKLDEICPVEGASENESILANAAVPKKLAPLFVKRAKISLAVVEARRHFLQSGVPESVKMKIPATEAGHDTGSLVSMPFPRFSHVNRHREIDSGTGNEPSVPYKQRVDYVPDSTTPFGSFRSTSPRDPDSLEPLEKADLETSLGEIRAYCPETNLMWQNIKSMNDRTPKKAARRRTKKTKETRTDQGIPETLNPTWTCKYKPNSLAEIVGNESSVNKLKDWLAGWEFDRDRDESNSEDDFESSSSLDSVRCHNDRVAVLTGPHGSGKTAAVYAIAEELGYRVLEMNASSKRTGKIILTAFQEATKSHRVKKDQTTLHQVKKRRSSERKGAQKSLILIEDVDLVFEEDEGFVTAIFQLAANTKRPIILTCRESCSYLSKMSRPQLFVNFEPATGTRVSALLELISLAESGYRLPKQCLDILLQNGDLRRSLLQLQYLLLTGSPRVSQLHHDSSRSTLWFDLATRVYKPLTKTSRRARKKSAKSESTDDTVETLAIKLNGISLSSNLSDLEEESRFRELPASLSLEEDSRSYWSTTSVGTEIADWLHRALLGPGEIGNEANFRAGLMQTRRRKAKRGVDLALSKAVSSTLEQRSMATDYLPLIRNMCRTEEDRARANNKRGKRFHSHLHNLNLTFASDKILSAASHFLRDETDAAEET